MVKGVCYSPCPMNESNATGNNLGDWFWDSFGDGRTYEVTGWRALWERDLPRIRAMGANCVRLYFMMSRQLESGGRAPSPPDGGTLFAHGDFLDMCWNGGVDPIHVLVGLPLPDTMFVKSKHDLAPQAELDFWTHIVKETAAGVADHPAVMGFTVQNELDGAGTAFLPPDWEPTAEARAAVDFWWRQVETFAEQVKTRAPGKLVGIACHDAPPITGLSGAYMAACPHIDFWGVNSYQTQTFDSVFAGTPDYAGYDRVQGAARKPVLFTEFGMPATGRTDADDRATIHEDADTRAKAADVVGRVVMPVFEGRYPLCVGLCYFEYCDEWWNQPGQPDLHSWWGGDPAPGFPNGYWDQMGFGLWSTARGAGLAPDDPVYDTRDPGWPKPVLPIDAHSERTELTGVLRAAFSAG
jgi:hypothetical protein